MRAINFHDKQYSSLIETLIAQKEDQILVLESEIQELETLLDLEIAASAKEVGL
jgi:hypothetical protein